jgi:hypothetical protein
LQAADFSVFLPRLIENETNDWGLGIRGWRKNMNPPGRALDSPEASKHLSGGGVEDLSARRRRVNLLQIEV